MKTTKIKYRRERMTHQPNLAMHASNLALWMERRGCQGLWPASLAESMSFPFSERPCVKAIMEINIGWHLILITSCFLTHSFQA